MSELERIKAVYAERDRASRSSLYAWYRAEVRLQEAERNHVVAAMLYNTIGSDLSGLSVLDVGCGTGGFLRTMVEWGGKPENLSGTEFLQDRLDKARRLSVPGINWHFGDLSSFESDSRDLVVANTVFSSVLDEKQRSHLASEMWRVLKPGGWIMIFDFRYNNPTNKNVKKVTRKELLTFWEANERRYKTLLLAPPIARKLSSFALLSSIISTLIPLLRSHFVFMARKP